MTEEKGTPIDPSGLNIIENSDGSFTFEWNKDDARWSWLNGLTDTEVKVIMEDAIKSQFEDLGTDND